MLSSDSEVDDPPALVGTRRGTAGHAPAPAAVRGEIIYISSDSDDDTPTPAPPMFRTRRLQSRAGRRSATAPYNRQAPEPVVVAAAVEGRVCDICTHDTEDRKDFFKCVRPLLLPRAQSETASLQVQVVLRDLLRRVPQVHRRSPAGGRRQGARGRCRFRRPPAPEAAVHGLQVLRLPSGKVTHPHMRLRALNFIALNFIVLHRSTSCHCKLMDLVVAL